MLARHGNKLPSHPIPGRPLEIAGSSEICTLCQAEVFSPALLEQLRSSRDSPQKEVIVPYKRLSQDLYASVKSNCSWCENLMRGILTAAHLDYWFDKWNGTHSDGSTTSDEESDEEADVFPQQDDEAELVLGNPEIDFPTQDEQFQHDLTLAFADFQANTGEVNVSLSFIHGSNTNTYTMIGAEAEVVWETRISDNGYQLPELKGDKAVQLSFEVFSRPGSQQSSLFAPLSKPESLASDQCFHLALNWIRECKEHGGCQLGEKEGPRYSALTRIRFPSHLIDLSHAKEPRIVIHSSLPSPAKYVALSYVWGMNQTYVLTKATREAKCRGLDTSRLPTTIMEAMEVTRRLGYNYLWVDALCIVQDDISNNGGELSAMGRIYEDSQVTIIAANASSSADGFLTTTESPEYLVQPFEIPIKHQGGSLENIRVGYRVYYNPLKDPINSRAWTFQERILSSRCLIYSYSGLIWSCASCENNPNSPPDAPVMFPRLFFTRSPSSLGHEYGQELRQTWISMRKEYTARKLTYGSDKLPAISAIASGISSETGWTYLAGIWKECLFVELHWHSENHSNIPKSDTTTPMNPLLPRPEYRAPSWSWACIDGIVVSEGEDPRNNFHFQILSCEVDYLNVNDPQKFNFGPVGKGILTVKGYVIDFNWRLASDGDDLTDIFLTKDDQGTTYIVGEALLDAQEPNLTTETKVRCLAMSVLSYENRTRLPVEGLMLLPSHDCHGESNEDFRRIGFFRIYSSAMFQDVKETVLRIV